jgi:hypothetical protein
MPDPAGSLATCLAAPPCWADEPIVGVRIEVREIDGLRVAVVLRNGVLAVVAPLPGRRGGVACERG